jgi:multisubunit Na+/H+ antiporter MnhB subunit
MTIKHPSNVLADALIVFAMLFGMYLMLLAFSTARLP